MKSIEVKGTARTIAERSSEQARALKAIRKDNGVPCVLYGGSENIHFTVSADGLRRSEERRVGKECRSRWSPYH